MKCRMIILLLGLAGGLSGCGAEVLGVGSLVTQGLQLAGGSENNAKAASPFSGPDHAADQRALEDLTNRAVSYACRAQLPGAGRAGDERDMTAKQETEQKTARVTSNAATASAPHGSSGRRQCGYREICLPGYTKPVTMLVCENV